MKKSNMLDSREIPGMWVETLNRHVKDLEQRTNVSVEDFKTAGRKTKASPEGEDLAFWQKQGLQQLMDYYEWLSESGWRIATMPDQRAGIEWDGITEFGGMPVKFIIDLVIKYGDDLIVTDFKTGKRTPFGCEQLALYASAVEKMYGLRPKYGAFFMTRMGNLGDLVPLDGWGIDYFEYQFRGVNEYLSTGYYPPNVGEHCGWCSLSDFCAAVGGSRSAGFPIGKIGKEQV
jgi:hypothetical protein